MTRVLLCDDSNVMLNLFERNLRAAGFDIVGKARDGEEGIRLYRETSPDLVFLDITMPNKDGRECLAELLRIDKTARVVMVSGLMDPSVIQDCLRSGAKAFIPKSSFQSKEQFEREILSVVNNLLSQAA